MTPKGEAFNSYIGPETDLIAPTDGGHTPIIFSKVRRVGLTPNVCANLRVLAKDLLAYFDELNGHPKLIKWTYTKAKLLMKFGTPSPDQLAA